MSASLNDINGRHREDFEKLLAASSKIVQLENLVEAADALIKAKDLQIEGLKLLSEAAVTLLGSMRPMFPEDLLPALDQLLAKAAKALALVQT